MSIENESIFWDMINDPIFSNNLVNEKTLSNYRNNND